jgi:hypothetical protein
LVRQSKTFLISRSIDTERSSPFDDGIIQPVSNILSLLLLRFVLAELHKTVKSSFLIKTTDQISNAMNKYSSYGGNSLKEDIQIVAVSIARNKLDVKGFHLRFCLLLRKEDSDSGILSYVPEMKFILIFLKFALFDILEASHYNLRRHLDLNISIRSHQHRVLRLAIEIGLS